MMTYFHPKDTTELLEKYLKANACDHLAYGMYYAALKQKPKEEMPKKGRDAKKLYTTNIKNWNVHTNNKKNLERVTKTLDTLLFETSLQNEVAILRGVSGNNKMLIGTGAFHVLETTLTIHQIYGVPYIPASSMKGLVRNWAVQAFFAGIDPIIETKTSKKVALTDEQQQIKTVLIDLFGDQENRGKAQFYDVFPSKNYDIVPDILTVHFKNYYDGKGEPVDEGSVMPFSGIQAITAEYYDVRLSVRKAFQKGISTFTSAELLQILKAWTSKMLVEHGIGAKTSSGYGQFSDVEDLTADLLEVAQVYQQKKAIAREKRLAQQERRKEEKLAVIQEAIRQQQLAAMPPHERLAVEIAALDDSQTSQDLSKNEYFQQIVQFAEEGHLQPATALRDYWKTTNNLKPNKKSKQFAKVQRLKELLQ